MEGSDEMMDDIFSRIDRGENLLFHGLGGTGKTYAIREVVKHYPEKNIMVMAPTGKAAVALDLNADTIHRAFNIYPTQKCVMERDAREGRPVRKYQYYKPDINSPGYTRPKHIDLIIIDEISMVGKELLEMVDIILEDRWRRGYQSRKRLKACICDEYDECKCNESYGEDSTMGEVQVIFCGDFYQLPPIDDGWCFNTDVWTKLHLKLIPFDQCMRYATGPTFDLLGRLRLSTLSQEDKLLLRSRKTAFDDKEYENLLIPPMILYATNKMADEKNHEELKKLEGDEEVFEGEDTFTLTKLGDHKDRQRRNKILDDLAPQYIAIKIGAKIMITRNFKNTYNLVNGTMGIIVAIEFGVVTVMIDDGSVHDINRTNFGIEHERYVATRIQYPFRLGWAITIHKSQGTTLDSAIVRIDDNKSPGQVYVAISRVRDINRLYIQGQVQIHRVRSNKFLPPEIL